MRAWWEQQAEREQRLLLAVAAVVILAILYWGLWAPLANGAAQSQQQRLAAERELEWLQAQAEGYVRSGGGGASTANVPTDEASMSTLVNSSARTFNIAISRMQPQGEMLQLWIDEVPWKQLLGWLEQLQREHGIVVNSVDLARGDSQGRVKVRRLELTRG